MDDQTLNRRQILGGVAAASTAGLLGGRMIVTNCGKPVSIKTSWANKAKVIAKSIAKGAAGISSPLPPRVSPGSGRMHPDRGEIKIKVGYVKLPSRP